MSRAYSPELMNLAFRSAASASQSLKTGIYAGLKGPSLETPAEIRFLRKIGADAVGFSTVQEVITAVHAGIHVLGLSIITNVHRPESPVPAYVKDIIEVAENASPKLAAVIKGVLENLHAE
jgi:purine-nucleoside phosphorylase